jgi:hypothetical protein
MITRIIRTAIVGAFAYYAAKKANAHLKLLAVRAEAKAEMDRLTQAMKDLFESGLSKEENMRMFDVYTKQMHVVERIYNKTF